MQSRGFCTHKHLQLTLCAHTNIYNWLYLSLQRTLYMAATVSYSWHSTSATVAATDSIYGCIWLHTRVCHQIATAPATENPSLHLWLQLRIRLRNCGCNWLYLWLYLTPYARLSPSCNCGCNWSSAFATVAAIENPSLQLWLGQTLSMAASDSMRASVTKLQQRLQPRIRLCNCGCNWESVSTTMAATDNPSLHLCLQLRIYLCNYGCNWLYLWLNLTLCERLSPNCNCDCNRESVSATVAVTENPSLQLWLQLRIRLCTCVYNWESVSATVAATDSIYGCIWLYASVCHQIATATATKNPSLQLWLGCNWESVSTTMAATDNPSLQLWLQLRICLCNYGCNRLYLWLQQTLFMAATDSMYGCNWLYTGICHENAAIQRVARTQTANVYGRCSGSQKGASRHYCCLPGVRVEMAWEGGGRGLNMWGYIHMYL